MSADSRAPRVPLPVAPHTPGPYDGPSREEILALRREYLNPGVFAYYKDPICIIEGKMQYVWDETGRQYLDAIGGIVTISVGHCHPEITRRVQEQVGKLVHTTTIYLHPNLALLGRELARRMPAGANLKSTYFTNSGSEANELAVLMARLHTGRHEVLAVRNGYHGGSQATIGLTAVGTWKFPVQQPAGIHHIPAGYCYRCPLGLSYPSCDIRCAQAAEDVIRYETSGEIAAFIAEPIQGVGGVVTPPPEYFKIVYEIVRKYGGLCIADEVQGGFGRTGEHYWSFENWDVTPDVVTMAKGIGNGAPLGACTTRPEVAEHMKRKLHFNTFGGNPVSAVSGLATLEIIEREKLQQRCKEIGGYLNGKLVELQERVNGSSTARPGLEPGSQATRPARESEPGAAATGLRARDSAARTGGAAALIGEIRGVGLMLGVELVKDLQTKEPASAETAAIVERCKDRGLLVGKGGLYGNVIRIKPPMCITKADCDFLVDCLGESMM